MSGRPVRVAVQVGAATVRVAAAEAEGEPWLLTELPTPGPGVAALLAELLGERPDELVLVHPAHWASARAAAQARAAAPLAGRVRTVPVPVAAAGLLSAAVPAAAGSRAAGRGVRAVLDVGRTGAEVTLVGAGGSVLAHRSCPVGGARLDAAVAARFGSGECGTDAAAEARRVREELSLLPATVTRAPDGLRVTVDELRPALAGPLGAVITLVREVLARAGPAPVLLVGGVARTPLLAELLDEAGIADVVVAPRPDAAAVLAALARVDPAAADPDRPGSAAHRPRQGWLSPVPPRRRPLRTLLLGAVAAGLVAGLLAVGALIPPGNAAAVPAGVLVQYGYRIDVPAGWEHTGGLPERRRVLLTPVTAPEGTDLLAVEASPLGYDAEAEAQRARAELRAEFDAAVAAGSALSGYDPAAEMGGREVTAYRQREGDGRTVVDWFVVLDGDAQLSVGCRHTAAAAEAVRAACAVVVGSVRQS